MRRLLNRFRGLKQPSGTNPDVQSSERNAVISTGRFEIGVGKTEKHLVEGTLIPTVGLNLTLDGQDAKGQLKFWKEGMTEIYEGDIGVQEKQFLRIEREPGLLPGWQSKIRVMENGRLTQLFGVRPKRTPRHVFFQNVLPFLLLFIIGYYALVYRPEVLHFYSGKSQRLHRPPQKHQIMPRALPNQPGRNAQLV